MGLPIEHLYATNVGDASGKILISNWIPEKRENGIYYMPKNTPIGFDMWINNVLDLKKEEGTVEVKIVKSDQDKGLYIFCYDDYFGNEQHLFNHMPPLKEGTNKIDWINEDELDDGWSLHVSSNINMKDGDDPVFVTLKRM